VTTCIRELQSFQAIFFAEVHFFCEISESEWLWDSVSAGYIGGFRIRAAAKLPNAGGNEVSESMGLHRSFQISESGHL